MPEDHELILDVNWPETVRLSDIDPDIQVHYGDSPTHTPL